MTARWPCSLPTAQWSDQSQVPTVGRLTAAEVASGAIGCQGEVGSPTLFHDEDEEAGGNPRTGMAGETVSQDSSDGGTSTSYISLCHEGQSGR